MVRIASASTAMSGKSRVARFSNSKPLVPGSRKSVKQNVHRRNFRTSSASSACHVEYFHAGFFGNGTAHATHMFVVIHYQEVHRRQALRRTLLFAIAKTPADLSNSALTARPVCESAMCLVSGNSLAALFCGRVKEKAGPIPVPGNQSHF